jgi:hypothetical protein
LRIVNGLSARVHSTHRTVNTSSKKPRQRFSSDANAWLPGRIRAALERGFGRKWFTQSRKAAELSNHEEHKE